MTDHREMKVVIADDDRTVLALVKSILQANGLRFVGEALDGNTAVRMCRELEPDIVVLDISMPLLNGIDAARCIIRYNSRVPARTLQGKSSQFDVLIRRSDASGNSAPRTLPMHKVELRRQVGALVRGKNGRGFSRHAGVYSSDVGRSVKEEAARDSSCFSRAAHIGSHEPPPGYPSAMVASLQCPLPFHLVSLFRLPP